MDHRVSVHQFNERVINVGTRYMPGSVDFRSFWRFKPAVNRPDTNFLRILAVASDCL